MKKILVLVLFFSWIVSVEAQNSEKELIQNTEKAVKIIVDTTGN